MKSFTKAMNRAVPTSPEKPTPKNRGLLKMKSKTMPFEAKKRSIRNMK